MACVKSSFLNLIWPTWMAVSHRDQSTTTLQQQRPGRGDSYGYFIAHPNELPHDKRKVGPWSASQQKRLDAKLQLLKLRTSKLCTFVLLYNHTKYQSTNVHWKFSSKVSWIAKPDHKWAGLADQILYEILDKPIRMYPIMKMTTHESTCI